MNDRFIAGQHPTPSFQNLTGQLGPSTSDFSRCSVAGRDYERSLRISFRSSSWECIVRYALDIFTFSSGTLQIFPLARVLRLLRTLLDDIHRRTHHNQRICRYKSPDRWQRYCRNSPAVGWLSRDGRKRFAIWPGIEIGVGLSFLAATWKSNAWSNSAKCSKGRLKTCVIDGTSYRVHAVDITCWPMKTSSTTIFP